MQYFKKDPKTPETTLFNSMGTLYHIFIVINQLVEQHITESQLATTSEVAL